MKKTLLVIMALVVAGSAFAKPDKNATVASVETNGYWNAEEGSGNPSEKITVQFAPGTGDLGIMVRAIKIQPAKITEVYMAQYVGNDTLMIYVEALPKTQEIEITFDGIKLAKPLKVVMYDGKTDYKAPK